MNKKLFCPSCGSKLTQWTDYDEETNKTEEQFSCFKCQLVYSYTELKELQRGTDKNAV